MNPSITCTKQSGAEQKLLPITDEQEAALFERPFRAQRTHLTAVGSSGTFRACCGSWAGSSATRRASCGSGAGSNTPVEHSAAPGQTRVALFEYSWSRTKVAADNRRTGGSTFRAAIANARNERTSWLWARTALFEHAAAAGQARAAPVEHSAPPGWLERHPSSILRFPGQT